MQEAHVYWRTDSRFDPAGGIASRSQRIQGIGRIPCMRTADHRLEIVKALCDIAVNAADAGFENDARRVERGILDHVDKLNLGKLTQDSGDPLAKMLVKAARYAQLRNVRPSHLPHRRLDQGFGPGDIVKPVDKLAHAINNEAGNISLYFKQALIQFAVLIEELPNGLDVCLHKAVFIATPHFALIGLFRSLKNLRARCLGLGKQPVRLFHHGELGPRHDMRAGREFELQFV